MSVFVRFAPDGVFLTLSVGMDTIRRRKGCFALARVSIVTIGTKFCGHSKALSRRMRQASYQSYAFVTDAPAAHDRQAAIGANFHSHGRCRRKGGTHSDRSKVSLPSSGRRRPRRSPTSCRGWQAAASRPVQRPRRGAEHSSSCRRGNRQWRSFRPYPSRRPRR